MKTLAVAGESEFTEEFVFFLFVGLVLLGGDTFGDGNGCGDSCKG